MLKSDVTTTRPNVLRHGAYPFINIAGLVVGIMMVTGVRANGAATQLAITIDDLPWVGPLPHGDSTNQALGRIAAVRPHDHEPGRLRRPEKGWPGKHASW